MNAWMHVAGWVLVHFVWQGAVVALVAALILRLCRSRAAAVRYVSACGAMGVMLLGVIATAALVEAPDADVNAAPASVRATAASRSDVFLPIEMNEASSPTAVSNARRVEMLLPWIVSAWLFGVIVLLARAGAGWWRVRRVHQLALTSISSTWQYAGNRIAARLGISRVIRIVELPHVDVPLVVGCLRPIVVLPIAAMTQLNVSQVEAILAHEIAHVRRHDYLVNLMQTLAETLLFYHPAVWWLSARIRDEREHCCDDVAVAVCGDPVGYAAALTELEALRTRELTLAPAATDGSLLNRVRRILRVEASDTSQASLETIGLLVIAGLAVALTAFAQTQPSPADRPKFEVASVRPNTSGDNKVNIGIQPGGRVTAVNVPLVMIIRNAYQLQDNQLVGAPDWVLTERYDITAKAEREFPPPLPGGAPSPAQLMFQSLLEERFKLAVHRETRELPIYTLVLARKDGKLGSQLTRSTLDCEAVAAARRAGAPTAPLKPGDRPICSMRMGFGQLVGTGFPLSNLARSLSQVVQRSVVDRTELTGHFDFDIKWTPDQLPSRPGMPADQPFRMNGVEIDPNGPSIFTALQEQLGLKLEATRGPVEVLVIDHVEPLIPD
jgi:uncharacterized protein (TIGR03435 family)